MATQISLDSALETLTTVLSTNTVKINIATAEYWSGLLSKDYKLHTNKTIQSSMSDPLAYFVVPLAGDGRRGRSHSFTLEQFQFALVSNWTKNAHIALRGVNEAAIKAGMSYSAPRADSRLGTVQGRKLAAEVATTEMNKKDKAAIAGSVMRAEHAPTTLLAVSNIAQTRNALNALKDKAARRLSRTAPAVVPAINDKTGEV